MAIELIVFHTRISGQFYSAKFVNLTPNLTLHHLLREYSRFRSAFTVVSLKHEQNKEIPLIYSSLVHHNSTSAYSGVNALILPR